MRLVAFLLMLLGVSTPLPTMAQTITRVGLYSSSDGTGNAGTWFPELSSGTTGVLPGVPSLFAGTYCSNDGTGNVGTWVPCTLLTSGSPATAPAFIPQNTTAGPQQYFFDDLYTAANVSVGAIGAPTGNSCVISPTNANANHPGQILVTSGTAGTGTGEACFIGTSGDGDFSLNTAPAWLKESEVIVPVLPGTTAASYQFGSSSGVLVNPWVNGFGFNLSSANAVANDWYCEKGATLTDSAVAAVASTWTRLTLSSDGTNLHYYINGTQVCGTGTPISTINANSMPAGAWAVTALSATSVTMGVDYLTSYRAVTR